MNRLDELRADYEALGKLLKKAAGSGAAAIVRERRILREKLEQLEQPEGEQSLIDELAERRKQKSEAPAKKKAPAKKAAKKRATKKPAKKAAKKRAVPAPPPARRRQSGTGG